MIQNRKRRSRAGGPGRRRALVGAALLGLVGLTGCATSAASSGTEQSGPSAVASSGTLDLDGYAIPVDEPLRFAFFAPFLGNVAVQTVAQSIKDTIEAVPGATYTVFDANGSPTTQFNQIQNAVESKQFNAAIVAVTDPNLLCNAVTQDMPQAGMVVVVYETAACDLAQNEGDQLRSPGTLGFVGGTHTVDYWHDYLSWVVAQNPGPQKVLVLAPAQLFPITVSLDKAISQIKQEHPEFEFVAEENTDYSVPTGFTKTQTMIEAHPDATILLSSYSTLSQGAVQALQAAGRSGSLRIYDKGATQWATQAVEDGTIAATTPEAQATSAAAAAQLIIDARAGRATPPVILNDGLPIPADAPASGFQVFTKDTIAQWSPEVP